jgi:hypothetical protein
MRPASVLAGARYGPGAICMSAEFIDTNILVYARSAAAKHDSAVELLENEKQGSRSLDLWSRRLG